MITENSTHKTQALAFSFFAFAGNIGIFLGPLIGTKSCDATLVMIEDIRVQRATVETNDE